MIKIGITGSIASGKTTASKILSYKSGPLFSADKEIKKFYKNNNFKKYLIKKFNIKRKTNFKQTLKMKIFENKRNIKLLEKIVHPMVRKEMHKFSKKYKKKNKLFYEIPLLVENKIMKHFDIVIFIKAKKKTRLKRFIKRGGDKNLFNLLNNKQLSNQKKISFSDHVVNNEKSLVFLKRKLMSIIKTYE